MKICAKLAQIGSFTAVNMLKIKLTSVSHKAKELFRSKLLKLCRFLQIEMSFAEKYLWRQGKFRIAYKNKMAAILDFCLFTCYLFSPPKLTAL